MAPRSGPRGSTVPTGGGAGGVFGGRGATVSTEDDETRGASPSKGTVGGVGDVIGRRGPGGVALAAGSQAAEEHAMVPSRGAEGR